MLGFPRIKGPPQFLVRVGLAAVEPLLALPPFPAALFRGWGFLVFLAFPSVLGGWGFVCCLQNPIRSLGRLQVSPGGVGFFK